MVKYHKIQTVFLRDQQTKYKTLLEGEWAKPEFNYLKDLEWIWTEKIDGTNIRVLWNGTEVEFRGKSDKAEIPKPLLQTLQYSFTPELLAKSFVDLHEGTTVCLYGEGYGKGIQKGGNYMPDKTGFILFDIKIGEWWLTREVIEQKAEEMGIKIVPIIGRGPLLEAVAKVKQGFISTISENREYMAEGLIMKPTEELFNRRGDRVITKIKHKDWR